MVQFSVGWLFRVVMDLTGRACWCNFEFSTQKSFMVTVNLGYLWVHFKTLRKLNVRKVKGGLGRSAMWTQSPKCQCSAPCTKCGYCLNCRSNSFLATELSFPRIGEMRPTTVQDFEMRSRQASCGTHLYSFAPSLSSFVVVHTLFH